MSLWLASLPLFKESLHFGPLLVVILLGIIAGSACALSPLLLPGIDFAQKPLLRWAVAGLGLKLSLTELMTIGGSALVLLVVSTALTLAFGWWLGKKLGLSEKLAILLSVGTSVCGASAIVAADSVAQAETEETAVSLGVITLWGTVGIFLLPWIGHALGMTDFGFGVWAGAALQEMAQVVAAGHAFSDPAAQSATIAKLARICLLAPIVLGLAWWFQRYRHAGGQAKVAAVPWFLVMFVVFAALNTAAGALKLPKELIAHMVSVDLFLLAMGMAGVGLRTRLSEIMRAGWRPVGVGLMQMLFLALVSLALLWALKLG